MYTFDHNLFLALNFDGGPTMDRIMALISSSGMWIPLYIFIAVVVWYRYGWQKLIAFAVCLALAMGLSDMLCGIFKHSGLLKHVWDSFPARPRPMFEPALRGLIHVPSYAHGPYGTVSSHAGTVAAMAIMSAYAVRTRLYTALIIFITLLICYSRIYLACHYPMDLALGLCVGLVSGGGMILLWRHINKLIEKLS